MTTSRSVPAVHRREKVRRRILNLLAVVWMMRVLVVMVVVVVGLV